MPDTGATDWHACPTRRDGRGCRCGRCAVCGHGEHVALHGPFRGKPPGSRPFGHRFVAMAGTERRVGEEGGR